MDIKKGSILVNDTKTFLAPILKQFDNEFRVRITSLFKLSFGVNDSVLSKKFNINNHIFILIDTTVNTNNFINTLKWLKNHKNFVYDYPFDNLKHGYQHMIVLKFPDEYKNAYQKFIESKFSEMYSDEFIALNFVRDSVQFKVLTKEKNTVIRYINAINKEFDTDFEFIEWSGEARKPITKMMEIFNFNL